MSDRYWLVLDGRGLFSKANMYGETATNLNDIIKCPPDIWLYAGSELDAPVLNNPRSEYMYTKKEVKDFISRVLKHSSRKDRQRHTLSYMPVREGKRLARKGKSLNLRAREIKSAFDPFQRHRKLIHGRRTLKKYSMRNKHGIRK